MKSSPTMILEPVMYSFFSAIFGGTAVIQAKVPPTQSSCFSPSPLLSEKTQILKKITKTTTTKKNLLFFFGLGFCTSSSPSYPQCMAELISQPGGFADWFTYVTIACWLALVCDTIVTPL
jgi:hypothetical protein